MALTTNIEAYYKLDNVNDSVGSNNLMNNGTATFTAGKIWNATDFWTANTSKYLSLASNLGITGGNITLNCWIKSNTEITTWTYPILLQWSQTNFINYMIHYDYNWWTRRIIVNRQKRWLSNNIAGYNITLWTSNWYMLTLTYDGTNLLLYVDWVQQATLSTSWNWTASATNKFYIGRDYPEYSADYSNILVDEVWVWSRALSWSEITQLYNSGNGLTYPFSPVSNSAFFMFL